MVQLLPSSRQSPGPVIGPWGAGHRTRRALGRGRLGPARISCLRGRRGLRGQGRPAGPSRQRCAAAL